MKRLILSLLAGAAAFAGLSIAHAQAIPAPTIVAAKATTVPFELFRGNRVIVAATVNGHATPAVLDTGASATTLDRTYARSIGIPEGQKIQARGAGGSADAELVRDVTLEIGGVRFEKMTVAVMDLSAVARAMGRPLPVIVGRELFNNFALRFDWDKGELDIAPAASYVPPASAVALPVERRGPFNFVKLSVAGLPPITAVLDLGNGGALNLPSDYWETQPALASLRYAETMTGGVGGLHSSRAVTLPSVSFAGRTFDRVPAVLGGDSQGGRAERDANLGIGMLKQFDLVLDLGRDRLFLSPRAAPVAFDRDRAGLRAEQDGAKLKVAFVSPQGPAARAGLKQGDVIVAVNGQTVTEGFYASAAGSWSRAAVGTPVTIALADGRTLRFQLEDYY